MKIKILEIAKIICEGIEVELNNDTEESHDLLYDLMKVYNDYWDWKDENDYEDKEGAIIYDIYDRQSSEKCFRDNDIRIADFNNFLKNYTTPYFRVESCRDIKPCDWDEIKRIILSMLESIILHILKNPHDNEICNELRDIIFRSDY